MNTASWLVAPEQVERKPEKDIGECRALYYASIPYRGRPVRVFAYLAMPEGDAPVPGIVLLHGGGGTAYPQWAAMWARRGIAALALDMEGGEPKVPGGYDIEPHADAGPRRTGDFDDSALPVHEHWMYHALAAASKGCSLLRVMPRVRADCIGLSGISWGGIAATNLITLDPRFCFCVPIYGCGCLPGDKAFFGGVFARNEAEHVWDPTPKFPRVGVPVLLINGLDDTFFSIEATDQSRARLPNGHMALLPCLAHGHEQGFGVQEAYAFADAVISGQPIVSINIAWHAEGVSVQLHNLSLERRYRCNLFVAKDGIRYEESKCVTHWETVVSQAVSGETLTLPLPGRAAFVFVNCVDDRGLVTTSNALHHTENVNF